MVFIIDIIIRYLIQTNDSKITFGWKIHFLTQRECLSQQNAQMGFLNICSKLFLYRRWLVTLRHRDPIDISNTASQVSPSWWIPRDLRTESWSQQNFWKSGPGGPRTKKNLKTRTAVNTVAQCYQAHTYTLLISLLFVTSLWWCVICADWITVAGWPVILNNPAIL